MILVGIDDTDTLDSRGTNKLAQQMVAEVRDAFRCHWIARHQLLSDPRIPFTSKNGSASLVMEATSTQSWQDLRDRFEQIMLREFIPGSDPGLCVVPYPQLVPDPAIVGFAHRCQQQIVTQEEARLVAEQSGVFLKGLGGTNGGIIGSLAAVGLAMIGNDGRVVQRGNCTEEPTGIQTLADLALTDVTVKTWPEEKPVTTGLVDVGKKLRPNLRDRRFVLFVEPFPPSAEPSPAWRALKLL